MSAAEARDRLTKALPHMMEAVMRAEAEGQPGAHVSFAIVTRSPDGSGKVTCELECREFLADVATLIDGIEVPS